MQIVGLPIALAATLNQFLFRMPLADPPPPADPGPAPNHPCLHFLLTNNKKKTVGHGAGEEYAKYSVEMKTIFFQYFGSGQTLSNPANMPISQRGWHVHTPISPNPFRLKSVARTRPSPRAEEVSAVCRCYLCSYSDISCMPRIIVVVLVY